MYHRRRSFLHEPKKRIVNKWKHRSLWYRRRGPVINSRPGAEVIWFVCRVFCLCKEAHVKMNAVKTSWGAKGEMAAANCRCRAAAAAADAKLLYLIVDDDVDVVGLASHVCYRNWSILVPELRKGRLSSQEWRRTIGPTAPQMYFTMLLIMLLLLLMYNPVNQILHGSSRDEISRLKTVCLQDFSIKQKLMPKCRLCVTLGESKR